MGIDIYVIWFIGWMFSAGILFMVTDEDASNYKTLLYALLMILIWPFFLGMIFAHRKV